MIYTTLHEIRRFGPCAPGWSRLLSYLGKTAADAAADASWAAAAAWAAERQADKLRELLT